MRPSEPERRTWSVLVVDDDADCREVVTTLLEEEGCRAIGFADGDDAVRYARTHPIDLAIVDLRLGTMDGAEVATAVRASGASRSAGLIALSGIVDPEWEIVRHFDAYLRKPLDPATFGRFVRALAEALVPR